MNTAGVDGQKKESHIKKITFLSCAVFFLMPSLCAFMPAALLCKKRPKRSFDYVINKKSFDIIKGPPYEDLLIKKKASLLICNKQASPSIMRLAPFYLGPEYALAGLFFKQESRRDG
jgi:hypothetical protein